MKLKMFLKEQLRIVMLEYAGHKGGSTAFVLTNSFIVLIKRE